VGVFEDACDQSLTWAHKQGDHIPVRANSCTPGTVALN
jgi:hypothetical protein